MSSLFIDSCQHYDINSINQKYNSAGGITISAAPAKFGQPGQCILIGAIGAINKVLPYRAKFYIGFRCMLQYPGSGVPGGNLYLGSLVMANRAQQTVISMGVVADGTIVIYGNNTLAFHSDPAKFTVANGVSFYIELSYSLSGSSTIQLTCDVRVNGQDLGSGGCDTLIQTNLTLSQLAQLDIHTFASAASSGTTYFRDLYMLDGGGSTNSGFLGDVNIGCIYPRQDKANSWLPAGTHWNLLNEHPPDGDGSFIYSDVIGNIDTCYFQMISSFTGTIMALQLLLYARKDAEGVRAIQAQIGNYTDPTVQYLADFYRYYITIYDSLPGVGTLNPTTVNGTDYGLMLNS